MYGLIGKVSAVPGQRDALAAVLLEGTRAMPGCLSYVIAADATDSDALWITEVWDGQASHASSLSLPDVRAAIAKGRPMIAGELLSIVVDRPFMIRRPFPSERLVSFLFPDALRRRNERPHGRGVAAPSR